MRRYGPLCLLGIFFAAILFEMNFLVYMWKAEAKLRARDSISTDRYVASLMQAKKSIRCETPVRVYVKVPGEGKKQIDDQLAVILETVFALAPCHTVFEGAGPVRERDGTTIVWDTHPEFRILSQRHGAVVEKNYLILRRTPRPAQ